MTEFRIFPVADIRAHLTFDQEAEYHHHTCKFWLPYNIVKHLRVVYIMPPLNLFYPPYLIHEKSENIGEHFIFTARFRRMREGNIFSLSTHSIVGGGVLYLRSGQVGGTPSQF